MKYYLYNKTRREAIVDFLLFYIPSTSTNKPLNYNKFPPKKKKYIQKKVFLLLHHIFHSESLSMLPMAFNPLGLFLELFFSLTSYLSWHISVNQAPGLTKSKLL